jgi:hypothetical protein
VTDWRKNLTRAGLITAAVAGLSMPVVFFVVYRTPSADPVDIAKAFYKATYARDFDAAYLLVSAADRRVREHVSYSEGSLRGFTLALAKRFADQIAFQVSAREVSDNRARLTLNYKVPAADEISSRLFSWDQDKLKALSWVERREILNELTKPKTTGTMISIEGQDTFDLVKENGHWRIFLDWASGIDVSFDAVLPVNSALEVDILKRWVFARNDEPFQSNLRLRNRGEYEVLVRIDHRIEPKESADQITMVACGFLRPLRLRAGDEREVSSAYLLDPNFPRNTKLRIAYQFALESPRRSAN